MNTDGLVQLQVETTPPSGGASIAARVVYGWTSIAITRGAERCPNSFTLSLTEKYPGQNTSAVSPGDKVVAFIGDDAAVTGYVDKVETSMAPQAHSISVSGRGKCQDLVDCSVDWVGGQIMGTSAFDVATKLALPYGVTVISDIPNQRAIPQFNVAFDENCYDVIERICRYSALLSYEDQYGRLVLTQVGKVEAASGFVEGVNIQAGSSMFSMDQRFSKYVAYLTSIATQSDAGSAGYTAGPPVLDTTVPRNRLKNIIAESVGGILALDLAELRCKWEQARRNGRSNSVALTISSWRDSAGTLWTPNTLVDIVSPNLHIDTTKPGPSVGKWIIGQVTYLLDDIGGTRSEIIAMPASAYSPQPAVLAPPFADAPLLASPLNLPPGAG